MLSCKAQDAAHLELDALGRSIRVSFDYRIFWRVWFWLSYLEPFFGVVPTIRSPLQVVTLSPPLTGCNSLPAMLLGTSKEGLPCPLHLLYHVRILGFDYCAWSPLWYLFGI